MASDEKRGLLGRFFGGKKARDAALPETASLQEAPAPDISVPDVPAPDVSTPDVLGDGAPSTMRLPQQSDHGALDFAPGEPVARFEDDADGINGLSVPDRRSEERRELPSKIAARLKNRKQSSSSDAKAATAAPEARIEADRAREDAALATSDWRVLFGEEEDRSLPRLAVAPEPDNPEDELADPSPIADSALGDKGTEEAGSVLPSSDERAETDLNKREGAEKSSWFGRLRQGLQRTSSNLAGNINAIFTKRKLDDETLEELEDALIQADLGIDVAMQVTEALAKGRYNKEISDGEVKGVLAAEVAAILAPVAQPLVLSAPTSGQLSGSLQVILMVGVNGSGKTTTIGKLAQKYTADGKKVMLAAGDTFRAAAIEQLKIWGERTGAPVISRQPGADAAGLAFDAMKEAQAAGMDVLLIDTAGRLQNKAELMAELEKIVRVIKKHDPQAPHHVILTLDATTGQNALSQADVFSKAVGVTGLVMTKLDGTARGGILVAIAQRFALPVHFIGVGEAAEDLQPFDARDFADAIAGVEG